MWPSKQTLQRALCKTAAKKESKMKTWLFRHATRETGNKCSHFNTHWICWTENNIIRVRFPICILSRTECNVHLFCALYAGGSSTALMWMSPTSLISSLETPGSLRETSAERIIQGLVLVRVLQLVFSVTAVHWMLLLLYSEPPLHLIYQLALAVCACVCVFACLCERERQTVNITNALTQFFYE